MLVVLVLLVGVTVSLVTRTWCADGPRSFEKYRKQLLVGVAAVGVSVEKIKEDAERDGLKRDVLRKDIEDRLRKAGIRVLIARESLRFPNTPILYINVTTIKVKQPEGYAFFLEAVLKETVHVVRHRLTRPRSKLIVGARTWQSTGGIGTTSARGLTKVVRAKVVEQVDEFIEAQRAGNPRRAVEEKRWRTP